MNISGGICRDVLEILDQHRHLMRASEGVFHGIILNYKFVLLLLLKTMEIRQRA